MSGSIWVAGYASEQGEPRYFAEGGFDDDGDIVIAADNCDESW